jgi:hypothetical protein
VLTFGGRQYQAVAGYEFGQFAVDPSRPAQWEYREVPLIRFVPVRWKEGYT